MSFWPPEECPLALLTGAPRSSAPRCPASPATFIWRIARNEFGHNLQSPPKLLIYLRRNAVFLSRKLALEGVQAA